MTLQVVSNLTYHRMAMHEGVDTHTLRKALWNYIHCLYGIRWVRAVNCRVWETKTYHFFAAWSTHFANLLLQLRRLRLRQRECVAGALFESVCQNHGLSPRADHGPYLSRLLETLQALWKGTDEFKRAPLQSQIIWHFNMSSLLRYLFNKERINWHFAVSFLFLPF